MSTEYGDSMVLNPIQLARLVQISQQDSPTCDGQGIVFIIRRIEEYDRRAVELRDQARRLIDSTEEPLYGCTRLETAIGCLADAAVKEACSAALADALPLLFNV